MDDASPPKWHLAHTSWFFETFILQNQQDFKPFNALFEHLFNSYYNGVGAPFPRPHRGFLSRPTVAEVLAYRAHVDAAVLGLLDAAVTPTIGQFVELGLNHEQQHQELIVTDLKFNFGHNPLFPTYTDEIAGGGPVPAERFEPHAGGIVEIGLSASSPQFKFDNESPRHQVLIHPFEFATRLVSNGEFLEFVQAGGYQSSSLWLSEGWRMVQEQSLDRPLYWHVRDGEWFEYRLDGLQPLDHNLPVVHLSGHESVAFAAWRQARLPTEHEWESVAASNTSALQNESWTESHSFHPGGYHAGPELQQMWGHVWQWTQSSYAPYPGFKPLKGTLGEYNGKFMSSQWVLRGGSCATPPGHVRSSYRNFFYPPDRWQFSGLRLARDA